MEQSVTLDGPRGVAGIQGQQVKLVTLGLPLVLLEHGDHRANAVSITHRHRPQARRDHLLALQCGAAGRSALSSQRDAPPGQGLRWLKAEPRRTLQPASPYDVDAGPLAPERPAQSRQDQRQAG